MTNQQGAPEALRLRNYVERRKRAKQLDVNRVHAFDTGCDTEAELLLSDVETLLSLVEAQQPAPSAAAAVTQQAGAFRMPPVPFEKVADGIEVGYDVFGGVDIRLGGDFVYVHINYDYRYTDNATRKCLADQIVGLLTTPQPSPTPQADSQPAHQWDTGYPPLPRPDACDGASGTVGWSERAMRGFVDADRAARATAESVPCSFGGPELQAMILAKCVEKDRADSQPAAVRDDLPTGAIINGRALAERLENGYNFECEAGPLRMCSDWQEFVRCFDYLATWVENRAARTPADSVTAPAGGLHPKTADLVQRFTAALAEKLASAEKKYGYSDGWSSPDWMDECRQKLVEHVAKGDPRDVAAYCAFLWHHDASTAPTPPAQAADSLLEDAALSSEQQRAIFEAYESAASESYFEVRPQIDCNDRRRVFEAGYKRGWDAARKQGGAT